MIEKKGTLKQDYADARSNNNVLRYRLKARAEMVVNAIRDHCSFNSGLRFLDLGAAEGRTLLRMNTRLPGNDFWGVEYSRGLIESAPALPKNIHLEHGEIPTCLEKYAPESFDIVTALAVLEHLSEPELTVEKSVRLLKPGGLLVATMPVPFWDRLAVRLGLLDDGQHETDMEQDVTEEIFAHAGLRVLEYKKFMWAPLAIIPYFKIPMSARFSNTVDLFAEKTHFANFLFVNQVVVAQKPSE